MDRWYISRAALLSASRRGPDGKYRIEGLERMAHKLGLVLPRMLREWHGYRLSLIGKLSRWVSKPSDIEWGR